MVVTTRIKSVNRIPSPSEVSGCNSAVCPVIINQNQRRRERSISRPLSRQQRGRYPLKVKEGDLVWIRNLKQYATVYDNSIIDGKIEVEVNGEKLRVDTIEIRKATVTLRASEARKWYATSVIERLNQVDKGGISGITPWETIEDVLRYLAQEASMNKAGKVFLDIGSGTGRVLAGALEICPKIGGVIGVEQDKKTANLSGISLCGNRRVNRGFSDSIGSTSLRTVINKPLGSAIDDGDIDCVTHAFAFQQAQGAVLQKDILRAMTLPKLKWIVLNWPRGSRGSGTDIIKKHINEDDAVHSIKSRPLAFSGGRAYTGKFLVFRITKKLKASLISEI